MVVSSIRAACAVALSSSDVAIAVNTLQSAAHRAQQETAAARYLSVLASPVSLAKVVSACVVASRESRSARQPRIATIKKGQRSASPPGNSVRPQRGGTKEYRQGCVQKDSRSSAHRQCLEARNPPTLW